MLVDRNEEGRHCKINVKDGHIVQRNFYLNALTWKEYTLESGQTAIKRPDLIARYQKKNVFGTYKAIARTLEHQERGLPHVHILLFLKNEKNRFDAPERIDSIISAEIPDADTDRVLYNIVTKNMMHSPFGNINPKSTSMLEDASDIMKCSNIFNLLLWL
ncbi:hypothetical protein [Parasitella parasitica]|uniref:Helitron helicase-like domain-containing protein n=1 Tax=Parasitella parasitica TaxID=35722 RepID=A0A0B7NH32_9FUNG|nr:hypothetical protein [Parasitella parasitica]